MKLPLKWEFPGGKIEDNEDAERCIIREIKEELNIDIKLLKKLRPSDFNYGTFSITLIPFLAEYIKGEIILAEHKDFKWLNPNELYALDWAEADVTVLEEFLKVYNDATWTL